MSEIYTTNNLIRFIYQETSPAETANIQHLLQHHSEAKEEYLQLQETLKMLDGVALNPHPTSIAIIMEHAHKQAAELI